MSQPQTPNPLLPFNGDNIPDTLKANARWAPWRAVWNEKRQKFDKIPAHAKAPFYGISTAKPERWYSYEQALKAYQDNPTLFAGLGYVMTGQHDVVGIDLDRCVADNTILPWAQDVIDRLASYTELSPSGNGLRTFIGGGIPNDWTNHEVGIEVYGGHEFRFLTVTGQRLKVSPLEVLRPEQATLLALSDRYAKTKTTATIISLELPDILDELVLPNLDSLPLPTSVVSFLTTGDHGGDRSRALFAASVALYSAGLSDDEVFSLLALNLWAFEVALDHRRQDSDRALMYLWVEHCQKGKAKSTPVATLADFENLAPNTTPAPVEIAQAATENIADDFDVIEDGDHIEADDLHKTEPITPPKPKTRRRFEVIPVAEFAKGAAPTWIVKGVLPRAELIVLYGASMSGKSFIALDLAGAVARGMPWRGRRVKQGRVVYVAAEGAGGFRTRLNAYALANNLDLDSLDLGVVKAAPNLMVKDDALELSKEILMGGPVSLVIFDTFAQVMPGANENAGEDVGKALQHCKGVHKATGATVVLVHHSGKDSAKGARGWSGLQAAADAELEVSSTPSGRLLRSTKQKDGEAGLEWGFTLGVVPVGVDEDGDVLTSCVVQEAAVPVASKGGAGANKNSGVWAARVLEVLGELTLVQTTGIEKKAALDEVVRRSPGAANESNRRAARRALDAVLSDDEGEYILEDGCISLYA
jgi:hypothetical protein